jgi:hypothetical protein
MPYIRRNVNNKSKIKKFLLIIYFLLFLLDLGVFINLYLTNIDINEPISTNIYEFNPKYNYYYGSLHGHYVEGKTSAQLNFLTAKDIAKEDFYGLTEHDRYLQSNEWNTLLGMTDNITTNDFVPLIGYEVAYSEGHFNVFNVTEVAKEKDRMGFYNWLITQPGAIAQWNHPADDLNYSFNKFADFSNELNNKIKLFEIDNNHNDLGTEDYESSYQLALDKGWKVGPTANPDAHTLEELIANQSRTVILAKELSKDSLLDAIRHLKFFATEDPKMKIIFEINGNDMGTNVPWEASLDFYVNAQTQTDNCISNIQIISNGGEVVDNRHFQKPKVERKVSLTQEYNKDKYYFVKVVTCSGKKAWSAPIWVMGI